MDLCHERRLMKGRRCAPSKDVSMGKLQVLRAKKCFRRDQNRLAVDLCFPSDIGGQLLRHVLSYSPFRATNASFSSHDDLHHKSAWVIGRESFQHSSTFLLAEIHLSDKRAGAFEHTALHRAT